MTFNSPWVIQERDAETLSSPDLWLLADGSHTGSLLGANRLALEAGAPGAKPHYHERSAEAFYVIDGALSMLIETEAFTLDRGGYAVVPAGATHAFAAGEEAPADVLITLVPGVDRFEYFRMLGELLRGELPEQEAARIHERYDVHFVDGLDWGSNRKAE
ncbi:cupin domain-containing protein [Glycomyces tarimensis]